MNKIEYENLQVIQLSQALLGAVSNNMRAVSININEGIEVYFLLEYESPNDREEIEDIIFEFEALQENILASNITDKTTVSSKSYELVQVPGRLVYKRKEMP